MASPREISLVLALFAIATAAQADWTGYATDSKSIAYEQGANLVTAGDYAAAIEKLTLADAQSPNDADTLNLIAFSNRKLGNYDLAAGYYSRALSIDPDHLGALEYQGELFITLGDLTAANANLARLKSLCPGGCDELTKLENALAGA